MYKKTKRYKNVIFSIKGYLSQYETKEAIPQKQLSTVLQTLTSKGTVIAYILANVLNIKIGNNEVGASQKAIWILCYLVIICISNN